MFKNHPLVQKALLARNERIAGFWLSEPFDRNIVEPTLFGKKVLVVDAEDHFTQMLAQKLKSIGLLPTVRKFDNPALLEGEWDLFVMGPGPGDPGSRNDPKIARLRDILKLLLSDSLRFLAICLSHQILCSELGIPLNQKTFPNQGRQKEIDFFGTPERVGFYNTYVAKHDEEKLKCLENRNIEVCYDAVSHDIHALKGAHFFSAQFHPESLLTFNGRHIMASSIKEVMGL